MAPNTKRDKTHTHCINARVADYLRGFSKIPPPVVGVLFPRKTLKIHGAVFIAAGAKSKCVVLSAGIRVILTVPLSRTVRKFSLRLWIVRFTYRNYSILASVFRTKRRFDDAPHFALLSSSTLSVLSKQSNSMNDLWWRWSFVCGGAGRSFVVADRLGKTYTREYRTEHHDMRVSAMRARVIIPRDV